MKPSFANYILSAKVGEYTLVDDGSGYCATRARNRTTGAELPVLDALASSANTWQYVGGPFNCAGYARMAIQGLCDVAAKVRIIHGWMNGNVFVPVSSSKSIDLTLSTLDFTVETNEADNLSVEVIADTAMIQALNESGNPANPEIRVLGRRMS